MGDYNSFFSKCDCVCSAPGIAFWAGEHAVIGGSISICQAFPQRVWVGLEPSGTGDRIEFGDHYILEFLNSRHVLQPAGYEEWAGNVSPDYKRPKADALIAELGCLCGEKGFSNKSFRIHLLSEFPPGFGGNWSGAFSAALACAVFALNQAITPEDVTEWSLREAKDLCARSTGNMFWEINRWAWRFEALFHAGSPSGYGTATSLLGGSGPIIFFTQKRTEGGRPPLNVIAGADEDHMWPSRPCEKTWIDDIAYSVFRLPAPPEPSKRGISCGLISSGVPKDTGMRIDAGRNLWGPLEQARSFLGLFFREHPDLLGAVTRSDCTFLKLCEEDGRRLLERYYEALSVSCIEAFHTANKLREGFSDTQRPIERSVFEQTGRVLCGLHGNLMQLDQNWPEGTLLAGIVQCLGGREVGVKLTGGGGGGLLFYIAPPPGEGEDYFGFRLLDSLRKLAQSRLLELRPSSGKICMQWLSDIDGFADGGVRIELPTLRDRATSKTLGADIEKFPWLIKCWQGTEAEMQPNSVRTIYGFEIDHLCNQPDVLLVDRRIEKEHLPIWVAGRLLTEIKSTEKGRGPARARNFNLKQAGPLLYQILTSDKCWASHAELRTAMKEYQAERFTSRFGYLEEAVPALGIKFVREGGGVRLQMAPGMRAGLILPP
jgi:mevalonate kinase